MKGGFRNKCFTRFCFIYWALWCLVIVASGGSVAVSQDGVDKALNENRTDPEENTILIESSKEETVEEIRSSIEEPDESIRRQSVQVEQSSQNSGIVNEFDGTNQGVPYTLVDTATAEFQEKVNELYSTISDQNKTADAFSNVTDSPITETLLVTTPDELPDIHNDTQEEIPSFSEWTQKQLEQVEKKKEQVNTSANVPVSNGKPSSNAKKRLKNYASPDCGAKLVHANPEAVSAGSILTASRDEYKLNACTNRIWFIVELCEAIQAKRIDLANFELFSSSPKDFSIFVSDRFPTRDWSSVGHFTAVDERDVQSFDLHPHLFGKYIKFEMHSHYGSEHYCPISLFRVYGTSEFEVLETENQIHTSALEEEEDDDDGEEVDGGKPPQNLFSSAKDAVISMVKKAAEVLGNKPNASKPQLTENSTDSGACTPLISSCTSPSHIVVCDNCSEVLFGNVFELLSCRLRYVKQLMENSLLKSVLYNSEVCLKYGLRFRSRSTHSVPELYVLFTEAFLPPKYVAAMCNIVAIDECKVVLNDSNSSGTNTTLEFSKNIVDIPVEEDVLVQTTSTVNVTNYENPDIAMQIQPTKTQTAEALNFTKPFDTIEDIPFQENVTVGESVHSPAIDMIEPDPSVVVSAETLEDGFENLAIELSEDVSNTVSSASAPPVSHQGQKESVFIRLSNRIKALELNMSLSSQYLEELSRRYKKQVEEMQRLLDKTISTLNEQTEQSELLNKKIATLGEQVEQLWECKAWLKILAFLLVSTAIVVFSFMYCCQRGCSCSKQQLSQFSMDLVSPEHRNCAAQVVPAAPKKSKKRKKSMQRSNSFTAESIEPSILTEQNFAPTKTSSRVWQQQASTFSSADHFDPNGIQDIPFMLEESEHSSLDTLVYSSLPKAVDLPMVPNGNLNGNHSSNTFTASESRSKRRKDHKKPGHKKSASVDATFTLDAPMTDSASVSSSLEENRRAHGQKKKGGLKKIFKTFTFK